MSSHGIREKLVHIVNFMKGSLFWFYSSQRRLKKTDSNLSTCTNSISICFNCGLYFSIMWCEPMQNLILLSPGKTWKRMVSFEGQNRIINLCMDHWIYCEFGFSAAFLLIVSYVFLKYRKKYWFWCFKI